MNNRSVAFTLILLLLVTPGAVSPTSGTVRQADADATARADLPGRMPRKLDHLLAGELESYVTDLLRRSQVPGAAVAVVQDGGVVFAKGFGVRELGGREPVTPQTLMMIGSTGKSMTTMMMASLVDEGKITWDTPAVEVYPRFASSDPALTPKITLRDMVCNCTGVQRHDLELIFAGRRPSAESVIESLRSFAFKGEYGKTFGYVNQMVGSGGYIAAWAARGKNRDIYANYLAQMRERLFEPIGMGSTTFSFERVRATRDRATPHGLTAAYQYVPLPLEVERMLEPVAPAGGSWSNALDMSRYLITQLGEGVSPQGRRVVSAENLKTTWKPQVEIGPGVSYGLGWVIAGYKGRRMLTHGGGTNGFTSDLTFLPDAGLGIVILTNAQEARLFCAAVRSRVLELAFDQPGEADAQLSARREQVKKMYEDKIAGLLPTNRAAVASRLGPYANGALGEVRLEITGNKLMLRAGGLYGELKSVGEDAYVIWDPPLAGGLIKFGNDSSGQATFIYDPGDPDVPESYRFKKITPGRGNGRAGLRPSS